MTELHKVKFGSGQRVIFVHSDGPAWSEQTFAEQRCLSDEFELLFLDRHGFGDNPIEQGDYNADAEEIIELLGEGAHLVGTSGGGLACLLAANYHPEAVRSLTVIEPPATTIARGDPTIENFSIRFQHVYEIATTPQEFWAEFVGAFGYDKPKPSELNLTDKELKGIQAMMTMRKRFYELEIPLDRLMVADFPILIVSGEWNNEPEIVRTTTGNGFKMICDVLQTRLKAQRVIFKDASHLPNIDTPDAFNQKLRAFLKSVK